MRACEAFVVVGALILVAWGAKKAYPRLAGEGMKPSRYGAGPPRRAFRPGPGRALTPRERARLRVPLPYTDLQNRVDAVVGNPDAEGILSSAPRLQTYFRSDASVTPEQMMTAERAAWALANEQDRTAPYDVERMTDAASDAQQAHATAPAINYQEMITDLVVDPRTRENHKMWTDEMQGWSGTTTMKVDTFEPELYLNWQGLRMPQAGVGQYNPMQITEVDDSMLARNTRFNFRG